jgi:hypothetical protein
MFRRILCLALCLVMGPTGAETLSAPETLDTLSADQEPLPAADPVDFIIKALDHYKQGDIKSYRSILLKQERIGDKLQPREEIELFVREKPYSVFMHWQKGARRADTALYVKGENNGEMLIHPAGLAGSLIKVVSRDIHGADARDAGRYPINDLGLKRAVELSLATWKSSLDDGTLRARYLGVRNLVEAGNRPCYTIRRINDQPDKDGVLQSTLYFDKETLFQIGSVLKGPEDKLLGEYIYRDIDLSAKLKENQFKRSGVAP